jgi:zona occludens toxin (predicted ATPase)
MSITIRAGRPGEGKSYTATQEILWKLKEGRKVYANWPVVSKDKRFSALVWEPWMIKEVILDADIYIDEAYRDYDSTDRESVDVDTHTFFATNRHNDVNGFLIAQNVARIAKKIREIAEYEYVKKVEIPFVLWLPYALLVRFLMSKGINPLGYEKSPRVRYPRPLWFTIYTYENEEKAQHGLISDAVTVDRRVFENETAYAYDTHYFRKEGVFPYESVTWYDHLENGIPVPHRSEKERTLYE